jgi:LuxR family maltose regulon positive regulatory protein
VAPVLDGSAPLVRRGWRVKAYLLEALAREALGDPAAADGALESAFDAAEPDQLLLPFLLYRAPRLLERHAVSCARHALLAAEILSLLPVERGQPIEGLAGYEEMAPRRPAASDVPAAQLADPLTKGEMRVLRYLPTHLSRNEIANELYLSPNTVKTHMRHLYDKLGTHRRAEAVERARALGLLAPAARVPSSSSIPDPGGESD